MKSPVNLELIYLMPWSGRSGAASFTLIAERPFVLFHGIYGGGWCWRWVSDLLERHGHKVFSPTLIGQDHYEQLKY
jgi:hypothetical protein